ncbi:hypothetical protein IQ06DRAFT_92628 [Phaeosphaeriaceae sp. SRC1lsM3a]|nr:hypothetical protein IQ06DRAFT_92628 [Stagonospora sp. SRC1lsM3a]
MRQMVPRAPSSIFTPPVTPQRPVPALPHRSPSIELHIYLKKPRFRVTRWQNGTRGTSLPVVSQRYLFDLPRHCLSRPVVAVMGLSCYVTT